MLKTYPKFKRNEIGKYYKKLPTTEKTIIKDYLEYRTARGVTSERKIKDIKRVVLQVRYIIKKNYNEIDLKDLRGFLSIINQSRLTESTRNNLKIDLKNFLKFLFKDWSDKFNGLEDIKLKSNIRNEEKINSKTIFKKEDIEKLMKHENKTFWKAFLITQYEGALRTMETRFLTWDKISFNIDEEISEVNIFATKTQKARTIFIKEATFYLKKLKEEQENKGIKTEFCFPSSRNIKEPVDKGAVSIWFRRLTEKALGRKGWNYLLRHSRATELYTLAKENKIAKDTAIAFMGHSEDMSHTYTHLNSGAVKKMLKDQVYKLEDIPEEKKQELIKRIEELEKDLKRFKENFKEMLNLIIKNPKLLKKKLSVEIIKI